MSRILPFYWPTKKIALDDEKSFLETVSDCLGKVGDIFCSTNPDDILDELNKHDFNFGWFVENLGIGNYGESDFNIDYKVISDIAANPKRYDIYSVLIVDYNMPQILGTEFCEKIDLPLGVRNILLTGNLDYKNGVGFLNQKQIHSFLSKGDLSIEALRQMVSHEEREFFKYHSRHISDSIQSSNPESPLFSGEYKNYFDKIIAKYSIREYYLLNDHGWFLLIDNHGNRKILFLFDEDDLESMHEEAEYIGLEDNLCNKIKQRQIALCHYNGKNGEWPEDKDWKKYLANIDHAFDVQKPYYSAIIDA